MTCAAEFWRCGYLVEYDDYEIALRKAWRLAPPYEVLKEGWLRIKKMKRYL